MNVVAPLGATPADLGRLREADFNVVLYPETARSAAEYLKKTFGQPFTQTIPIGVGGTRRFVEEVAGLAGIDPAPLLDGPGSRLPWYSRSVDSTYLTAKRVFVFGDATHAIGIARVAAKELGFTIVGLGTYGREFAREVRAEAALHGIEALITDDYLDVEAAIRAAAPELVLGTQMERHVAKRLGIPCAVISAPVHVQDFPARYAPQMGFEGANVLFDTLVHPLMMGLEEHLLGMFREDPEFHDGVGPSHLGGKSHGTPADGALEAAERAPADPPPTPAPVPILLDRAGRGDALVPRGREGTQEDPVLRAGQGAHQHRDLRPGAAPAAHHPRDPLRCQSALRPLGQRSASSSSRSTIIWRARWSGRGLRLRSEMPGLVLGFHAAAEWDNDPATLEACRTDIAQADIVLSAMLFMDEHVRAILPALAARARPATRWSAASRPARW